MWGRLCVALLAVGVSVGAVVVHSDFCDMMLGLAHGGMGIYRFFLGFASLVAAALPFTSKIMCYLTLGGRTLVHFLWLVILIMSLLVTFFILLMTRAWISRTLASVLLPIIQQELVATWPSLTYHGPEVNGPVLKIFL